MEKPNTIELTKNNKQMSDKALIAKLRYELEESQVSNMKLYEMNIWQKKTIERLSKMIDRAIDTTLVATQKIKHLESEIENQNRTIIFLNDWKFTDHKFQLNIKATCDN